MGCTGLQLPPAFHMYGHYDPGRKGGGGGKGGGEGEGEGEGPGRDREGKGGTGRGEEGGRWYTTYTCIHARQH